MPHILKNQQLKVLIDLPHENYLGSRFDWSGKIREVHFEGKPIAGVEILNSSVSDNYGRGFYNEFGITTALGYDEAAKGGWFHKIGIGLLQKDEEAYSFQKDYAIEACDFNVKSSPDNLLIECHAPMLNGYAYLLKKRFSLSANGFAINYQLINTGDKTIVTDEYNHNFLALQQDLIGADYRLSFPFKLRPDCFVEYVDPDQILKLGPNKIAFKDQPKEAFFISNLSGGEAVEAHWDLIDQKHNIGIREIGDFQCKKINLWGCGHVMSPELFVEISLPPNQSFNWTRRYEVFHLSI